MFTVRSRPKTTSQSWLCLQMCRNLLAIASQGRHVCMYASMDLCMYILHPEYADEPDHGHARCIKHHGGQAERHHEEVESVPPVHNNYQRARDIWKVGFWSDGWFSSFRWRKEKGGMKACCLFEHVKDPTWTETMLSPFNCAFVLLI